MTTNKKSMNTISDKLMGHRPEAGKELYLEPEIRDIPPITDGILLQGQVEISGAPPDPLELDLS
ncbi:MAG: hypothetical protein IKC53_03445 [Lentisphaeria bacterium]|nr:hypothetical protein [Lentisphaeria bacterium]MBR3688663.1 hypothetical protein [Lentisphaeria bacterium]